MRTLRKGASTALATLALLSITTACGNINAMRPLAPRESYDPTLFSSSGATSAVSVGDSTFSCPYQFNITPDYDWELDGTGFYSACPSTKNQVDVLVRGETADPKGKVCVFPGEYVSESQFFLKPDLRTGSFLYQCMSPGGAGGTVTFPATKYNALIIVDARNLAGMLSCLPTRNWGNCPAFSHGKFR